MSTKDILQAGAAGAADTTDPYFKNVSLLLHGDGTNGAQNNSFVDSSPNAFAITRNGNTTQGSFSPYGSNWSNYFGPITDGLTVTGLSNSIAGDFTVEGFFFFQQPSTNSDCTFFGPWQTGRTTFMVRYQHGATPKRIQVNINGATVLTGNLASSLIGAWHHVAVARISGTLCLFLNGSLLASVSNSSTVDLSTLYIGREQSTTTTDDKLVGYASSVRVSTTVAFYTAAFTPPTTPLTAISGTALLTCQSNRFIDNSSNNFSITANGTPSVQKFSPFAPTSEYLTGSVGGSGYFDAGADYLSCTDSTGLGSGDFTVEGWFYRTGGFDGAFSIGATAGTDFAGLTFANGGGVWYSTTGISWDNSFSVPNNANQWNHIAFVRNGSTIRAYVNGISVNSGSVLGAIANKSGTILVGVKSDAMLNGFPGYISNFRIVKGVALYTTNFTPPTSPLTAVTNTSLLLNFTNAGIFDNAMMNDLETVGNAQISTSVKKYGTGSMYFDGSGDYLSYTETPWGTQDFTVEFWYNTSVNNVYKTLFANREGTDAANTVFAIGTNPNGGTYFYSSAFVATTNNVIPLNTWVHLAYVRNNNVMKIYINGVEFASGAMSNSFTYNKFYVGANGGGSESVSGYIDELRITKGVARYTANFTPPSQAFPNQ